MPWHLQFYEHQYVHSTIAMPLEPRKILSFMPHSLPAANNRQTRGMLVNTGGNTQNVRQSSADDRLTAFPPDVIPARPSRADVVLLASGLAFFLVLDNFHS